MRIYGVIFRVMPINYRKWVKNTLIYAGFSISPEMFAGFSFIYGLLLAICVSFFVYITGIRVLNFSTNILTIISGLLTLIVFEIIMHSIPLFISDKIAKFVDEILPDALRLVSANIRSGLTPDKAFLLSARPEFGPLEKQIRSTAKMTLSGTPIEEAIQVIPKNINSKATKRSIDLLVEGIARGGNLANLLDGLADDIRQTKILKREVQAYVMMYAIFIFFAAGIGAPLLYGISSFLVETMQQMGSQVSVKQSFSGSMKFMTFQGIMISSDFLMLYSILSLTVTSIFGGILIGLIQEGEEKAGLRYIPLLLLVSLSVFFIARFFVTRVFTSITVG